MGRRRVGAGAADHHHREQRDRQRDDSEGEATAQPVRTGVKASGGGLGHDYFPTDGGGIHGSIIRGGHGGVCARADSRCVTAVTVRSAPCLQAPQGAGCYGSATFLIRAAAYEAQTAAEGHVSSLDYAALFDNQSGTASGAVQYSPE